MFNNKLKRILEIVNDIGGNPESKIEDRKSLRKDITDMMGESSSYLVTYSFKQGYIRKGAMWGFVLTKNGLNKLIQLREQKNNGGK